MLLTPIQLERAHALGQAHGHKWAQLPLEGCPLDLDAIQERTCDAAELDSFPGIERPDVDDFGHVVHETMTGRLSWEIDQEGTTLVTVYRPAGWVLAAVVGTDGALRDLRHNPTVSFHARHTAALQKALEAVLANPAYAEAYSMGLPALPDEDTLPDTREVYWVNRDDVPIYCTVEVHAHAPIHVRAYVDRYLRGSITNAVYSIHTKKPRILCIGSSPRVVVLDKSGEPVDAA